MGLFKTLFAPSAGVQVTPDETHGEVTALATAGHDFIIVTKERNEIIIWDSTTLRTKQIITDLDAPVSTVAASHPAGLLASTDEQGRKIRTWEIGSGKERPTVEADETVTAMAYGASGLLLALGYASGAIGVYDTAAGKTTRTLSVPKETIAAVFKEPPGKITRLSFSSDGRFIAGVENNGAVLLWDLNDSGSVKIFVRPPHKMFSVQFSRDNRFLLTAGGGYSISINISDGNAQLSIGNCAGTVSVYDVQDGSSKAASLTDEVIEDAFWTGRGAEVAVQLSVPPPRDGMTKFLRLFNAANLDGVNLREPNKELKLKAGPLHATSAYCQETSMFMIHLKGSLLRYSLYD